MQVARETILNTLIIILILLFFTTKANSVFAQNNEEEQDEYIEPGEPIDDNLETSGFFELDLFSLSKHTESSFDAPAAVYVIDGEEIRRSGATRFQDAIRLAPGLHVSQQSGNVWAIGSRGFNFQFTNKMLVLVDGRSIYTPLFAGVFWNTLDYILPDIERIEIIRGPGATIWGSNAVNGIINIITKEAGSSQGNHVSLSFSQEGDHIESGRIGKAINENTFARFYIKNQTRAGLRNFNDGDNLNDGYRNTQAGFRIDTIYEDDTNISVYGDIRQGISYNFFKTLPSTTSPFTREANIDMVSQGANITLSAEKKLDDNSEIQGSIYFDYDRYDFSILKRAGYTLDIDFQHIIETDESNQLIWGLGHRHIQDSIDADDVIFTFNNLKRTTPTTSAFIQDRYELLKDALFITAGSKFEYNDYTGFEFQPSLKLTYFPSDNQTLWGSVTRAIRTPGRGEFDGFNRTIGTAAGFIALTPGPNYKSEELYAFETGYRIKPIDTMLIEGTVFVNSYDDLRTSETGKSIAPQPNIISGFGAQNNGSAESYGVEINTKIQATESLKILAGYSFFTADLHVNPNFVSGAAFEAGEEQYPKNQFTFNVFWNVTPEFEIDNNFYYVDDLSFINADAHIKYDLKLSWKPDDKIDVSLLGKDLLDNDRVEFNNALHSPRAIVGRNVYLNFNLNF